MPTHTEPATTSTAPISTEFLTSLAPSLPARLRERVAETPATTAFRYPYGEHWISRTWAQTGSDVDEVAAGMLALGLRSEDRVGIMASTRYEWIIVDLGILSAGGATTTVYPTTGEADAAYIIADAGCRFMVVEDAEQLEKVLAHRAELPLVETIIVIDTTGVQTSPKGDVRSLADLRASGRDYLSAHPDSVTDATAAIAPEALATLIYTSGTTGRPKGVRLTHHSWVYEGEALKALGFLFPDDVNFLWLPMSHSFGKVILSTQLAVGFTTAIDGRVERIIDNLAIVQPTFMGAAPRIFEKAYAKIVSTQAAEGGLKEKLFTRAFAVGVQVQRLQAAGQPIPTALALQHKLVDRLVFSKVRTRFGGKVRFFISGSAPLNREIGEWFGAAGILIVEGYGLTETSAGAFCGRPVDNVIGTVGRPLPGSQVRIGDDGEIQIQGPHVMAGYHGLPEETAAAFTDDGWLRTGDQGSLDTDGFLTITGRIKDLLKTSGGKIVVPGAVEAAFKVICPYASQFLVFGDDRPFCVALVTLDPDAIAAWATDQGIVGDYAAIVKSPEVRTMLQAQVDELNTRLNRWETVKRFEILDADLTIESGELTPSMKVKRGLIERQHEKLIAGMYA